MVMRKLRLVPAAFAVVLLTACGSDADDQPAAAPSAAATQDVPPPARVSFLPDAIRAFGTEPFWSADISAQGLTYTTPDNLEAGGSSASVTRADGAESVKFTATLDGQVLEILVTNVGDCSDGMSDNLYPWTVERTLGDDTVQGCAESAKT